MASSSDNSKNNKRPLSPSTSPQASSSSRKRNPNPYEIYGVSQHVWDKCNEGPLGAERHMLEMYEKLVQKLKENIKRDEESIRFYFDRIDKNNKKIAEYEEKITDLIKNIFSPDP